MKPPVRFFLWFLQSTLALACSSALAGKTHEHGAVKLNLAIEATEVTVAIEMPLDSLVGFERAPRTDAERQAAAAALAKMRDGSALFQFDAKAECSLKEALIEAPVLEGPSSSPQGAQGHADLEAIYRFKCHQHHLLGSMEVRLFESFRRIERIQVQAALPQGQKKMVLRPSSRSVRWTP